jgi:cysteine desulfuration protein SufE
LPPSPPSPPMLLGFVEDALPMTIDALIDDFRYLDDWEDRYRYVIELGKALPPLGDEERTDANKVRGCASQVWMVSETKRPGDPVVTFRGDSDAHIVRGLIAILLALYSGRPAKEIVEMDPESVFAQIGLREHLTSQRSNGLTAMVSRMRTDAASALATA